MCGLPLDLDKPAPASLCDVVRLCTVITTVLYLLHYNIMYVAMFTLLLCIVSQLYCVISCSGSGREASEVNAAAGLTLGRPGSASDALYFTLYKNFALHKNFTLLYLGKARQCQCTRTLLSSSMQKPRLPANFIQFYRNPTKILPLQNIAE